MVWSVVHGDGAPGSPRAAHMGRVLPAGAPLPLTPAERAGVVVLKT
jgi:hypothetical protein